MEVFQTLLVEKVDGPAKASTGGTSKGDPSAGTGGTSDPRYPPRPISRKDRIGAGIMTVLAIIGVMGGVWWMIA
jgi:mannan endo-1,6-alpha-mannosidase